MAASWRSSTLVLLVFSAGCAATKPPPVTQVAPVTPAPALVLVPLATPDPDQVSLWRRHAAPTGSLEYFKRTCLEGGALGCSLAAEALDYGLGAEFGTREAVLFHAYGCALFDSDACGAIDGALDKVRRFESSEARWRQVAEEGAWGGDAYARGDGVRRDLVTALRLYAEECRMGRAESCVKQGIMEATGKGGPRAPDDAFTSLDVACDLDRSRCMDIALMYKQGKLGKHEHNKLHTKWFRKRALRSEGKKKCRYGEGAKCVTYAYGFLDGKWVNHDPEYAFILLEEACNSGDQNGCTGLGNFYVDGIGVKADPGKAVKIYREACAQREEVACWKLGRLHLRGEHVTQDLEKAKQLFRDACAYGNQAACDFFDD
jgi:hypothetical protein